MTNPFSEELRFRLKLISGGKLGQLCRSIGIDQSTMSYWITQGHVPEARRESLAAFAGQQKVQHPIEQRRLIERDFANIREQASWLQHWMKSGFPNGS